MDTKDQGSVAARLRVVEEHVRCENQHDLDGIMSTFGPAANYEDLPERAHHKGYDAVREFYAELLRVVPDLQLDIQRRYAAPEAIILEVIMRGRHLGNWRGLPPTGRRLEFPLCGVFTFDDANRLAGERIYYDRGTVLAQLVDRW
jgi:steroid delta-isomerase-like uncharacterized protein